jgi:hypothetical protein
LENVEAFPDEPPFLDGVFLQDNAREPIPGGAIVPEHVHEILAAIIVME